MKKWEYRTVILEIKKTELELNCYLNELGKEGWELITVYGMMRYRVYYFKREIV
ncbi:DUF4177 domain-containing protein [bacterium]|nr:DUF4177 domain-containing protein [bacterium]